jgi:hypothetical protein
MPAIKVREARSQIQRIQVLHCKTTCSPVCLHTIMILSTNQTLFLEIEHLLSTMVWAPSQDNIDRANYNVSGQWPTLMLIQFWILYRSSSKDADTSRSTKNNKEDNINPSGCSLMKWRGTYSILARTDFRLRCNWESISASTTKHYYHSLAYSGWVRTR